VAVMVIAGSGRGAGKTAVGCALIAALPEFRWAVVKVSPHLHGVEPGIWEEADRESDKDTGRYLASGAERAFLVSGELDSRAMALEARVRASGCDALLVESNRILPEAVAATGERTLSLAVLAGASVEWKASLPGRIGSVDALVLTQGLSRRDLPGELWERLAFCLPVEEWASPELVGFVRERFRV